MKLPQPSRWWRVALALLLLLALALLADWRSVLATLASADLGWALLGLLSAIAANLASALRWHQLASWLGGRVSHGWALREYLRGLTVNAVLPGAVVGGDVYRATALTRSGMPALEAAGSVLLDRLSGLWLLVVLGALAAAYGLQADPGALSQGWLAQLGLSAGWTTPVFGLLALLLLLAPVALGAGLVWGLRGRRLNGWWGRLAQLLLRPGLAAQYGWQVLGSGAVQLLSVSALACAGQALGVGVPWWTYAVASVPIFLLATLPIGFGGWGTREAAALVSLGAFGVAAPQALGASVFYGLFALAQALAGCLLWLLPAGGRR